MPFIWIDSRDRSTLETTFADDESVADFQLIADFETDYLYQVEWIDHIEHLVHVLVEQKATVLRATGHDDRWELRLLFADHEMVTRTNDYCVEHGLDFDVANIHDFTDHSSGRVELTECQQTALQTAADRGYYAVPREATADDLSEEFGISHQALSERLRRAHGNLVHHVLDGRKGMSDSVESTSDSSAK